jgi:predicted Ser/Thr protein kinase
MPWRVLQGGLMRCRSCDAELTPGARFCAACAAPAPLAPGDPEDALRTALEKALGFQYRVERLLGRGGMGAVYLACELALDREVAIKVLPPERGADEDSRARFRREARTAARLSHPNIVPLITFGEVNGLAYYVMGYVRGESLAARMRREGRMPPEEVARVCAEVADALDYAHRQGVVHRDIKPDNVLIDADSGRAMLTDFGVARAQGSQKLTSAGAILGTPRYMSPEQAAGAAEVDGRSDLYSLGILGYEMLAGDLPFDGRTPSDQLVQRLTREPTPLAPRVPDAPMWLTAAITRCLERSPTARWADARGLRQQLLAGGTENDLPRALETLGSYYQAVALGWLLGFGYWMWGLATIQPRVFQVWDFDDHSFNPDNAMVSLVFTLPLLLLMTLDVRRKGYSWTAIRRAVIRQPRWWMGPYPRAGRAPGDVWPRLPGHVRTARTLISGTLILVPLLALRIAIDLTAWKQYEKTGTWSGLQKVLIEQFGPDAGMNVVAAVVGGWALLAYFVTLWSARRFGSRGPLALINDPDGIRPLYTGATGNARFWSRPTYEALLLPARPRLPTPMAPSQATAEADITPSDAQTQTRAR